MLRTLIAELEYSIDTGLDDAIIAILIHYLPSLETINISDTWSDCLQEMMFRIAMEYRKPFQSSRIPLQRLKIATVSRADTKYCCSVDWVSYFLCVPSLQTFAARRMGGLPSTRCQELLDPKLGPRSDVTELFFSDSRIHLDGLGMLLKKPKELKKFTYTEGQFMVCDDVYYAPKLIIECVAANVADSLEKLVLDLENDTGGPVRLITLHPLHKY